MNFVFQSGPHYFAALVKAFFSIEKNTYFFREKYDISISTFNYYVLVKVKKQLA